MRAIGVDARVAQRYSSFHTSWTFALHEMERLRGKVSEGPGSRDGVLQTWTERLRGLRLLTSDAFLGVVCWEYVRGQGHRLAWGVYSRCGWAQLDQRDWAAWYSVCVNCGE